MSEKKDAAIGRNRTGLHASKGNAASMLENAKVEVTGDGTHTADQMREPYLEDRRDIGSAPPPPGVKGMAKAGLERLKGNRANVLIDRIAERLAFERAGTRLYEALVSKCREKEGDGCRHAEDLQRFHDQEHEHVRLLKSCLEELGADPTAVTPSADLVGVESQGIVKAITDPRTSVSQSLHALLVAELADREGWEMLVSLADEAGRDEMAKRFRSAQEAEEEHLRRVRGWVQQDTLASASPG